MGSEKIIEIFVTKNRNAFKENTFFSSLRKILISPVFYHLIRVSFGCIFIYAGFIKLIDPKAFAKAISQYELVPEALLAPVAIGLPSVELLAGLGLIFSIPGSLTVIFSLLIGFASILGYGIFNNLNIDCGCFTPEDLKGQESLKQAFYRDLVMIAAVFYMGIYRHLRYDSRTGHVSWL
jgi:uncharacterized membrane protein YphA (DoxX/SURF4 family)